MKNYIFKTNCLLNVAVCSLLLIVSSEGYGQVSASTPIKKPNVIFISIDDLNDWINPLEHGGLAGLQTPNFDRLRKMSMSFTNAHVASPSCAPSRLAVMTGVHSARSGANSNAWGKPDWRGKAPALREVLTMEQFFKEKGYETLAGGKIYHTLAPPRTVINQSEPQGWDYYYPSYRIPIPFQVRAPEAVISPKNFTGDQPDYFTWGPISLDDEYMADYHIAEWANYELNRSHDKPLFLAVGLTKPHDPWEVPQKYFDMYPLESVPDLEIKENDLEDAYIHGRRPLHKFITDNNQVRKVIQSYMATISFTDAMLGKLLDGLEKSAIAKNAIIVLWSDHGMHMGEKENWEKFTLWERSTRAPLFIIAPGITKPGSTTHVPVSMIDIFPTLAELTGQKIPAYCDGESLVPMLKNQSFIHTPVLSSFEFKLAPGPSKSEVAYAIRSDRYRYIYYPFINFEELYDHSVDKNEWDNIAYKSMNKKVIQQHREMLLKQAPQIKYSKEQPEGYQISADGTVKKTNYIPLSNVESDAKWH